METFKTEIDYFSKYIKTSNKTLISIMNRCIKTSCERSRKRIKDILSCVLKKDKDGLRKLCYDGLPDDLPILRSLIWKINLRYLNYDVDKWDEILNKKRSEYNDIKSAFLLKLNAEVILLEEYETLCENNNTETETDIKKKEDLHLYIQGTDKLLLEEIEKDVSRTHTNLNFFFMPSCKTELEKLSGNQLQEMVEKRRSNEIKTLKDIYPVYKLSKCETHSDVLSRILYVYAKLNPEISYVQRMNEILAPIYYCFSFDYLHSADVEYNIEADAFWSFAILMDDLKPMFCRDKDSVKEGIFGRISFLNEVIGKIDKEIFLHFNKMCVECGHFAFKWFILFFSQDFIMPDLLRLWDTLFCEKDRYYFIYFLSLAILKLKKEKILKCDLQGE